MTDTEKGEQLQHVGEHAPALGKGVTDQEWRKSNRIRWWQWWRRLVPPWLAPVTNDEIEDAKRRAGPMSEHWFDALTESCLRCGCARQDATGECPDGEPLVREYLHLDGGGGPRTVRKVEPKAKREERGR